jgi:hypothetical protein
MVFGLRLRSLPAALAYPVQRKRSVQRPGLQLFKQFNSVIKKLGMKKEKDISNQVSFTILLKKSRLEEVVHPLRDRKGGRALFFSICEVLGSKRSWWKICVVYFFYLS